MNLRLLQLGDSALPIGGYCHSWGLEAGIARGLVSGPAELEAWTRYYLANILGPLEGVVVAAVVRSQEVAVDANRLLWAAVAPPTLRLASRDMGEQLLSLAESWEWAEKIVEHLRTVAESQWHHAVVFACLAAAASASAQDAVAVFLHQSALGVISAGVRRVPIGHTHGQQILTRLHGDVADLAGKLYDKPLETAGSLCPVHEILCHEQSQLYTRLFRS